MMREVQTMQIIGNFYIDEVVVLRIEAVKRQ